MIAQLVVLALLTPAYFQGDACLCKPEGSPAASRICFRSCDVFGDNVLVVRTDESHISVLFSNWSPALVDGESAEHPATCDSLWPHISQWIDDIADDVYQLTQETASILICQRVNSWERDDPLVEFQWEETGQCYRASEPTRGCPFTEGG